MLTILFPRYICSTCILKQNQVLKWHCLNATHTWTIFSCPNYESFKSTMKTLEFVELTRATNHRTTKLSLPHEAMTFERFWKVSSIWTLIVWTYFATKHVRAEGRQIISKHCGDSTAIRTPQRGGVGDWNGRLGEMFRERSDPIR